MSKLHPSQSPGIFSDLAVNQILSTKPFLEIQLTAMAIAQLLHSTRQKRDHGVALIADQEAWIPTVFLRNCN